MTLGSDLAGSSEKDSRAMHGGIDRYGTWRLEGCKGRSACYTKESSCRSVREYRLATFTL